ncbi:hypothetical protein [Roseovarius sp. EL26]|nr:hypothetical protein [Roseovarius sp. EL26]
MFITAQKPPEPKPSDKKSKPSLQKQTKVISAQVFNDFAAI